MALYRVRAALGSAGAVTCQGGRYRLGAPVLAASDVSAMRAALQAASPRSGRTPLPSAARAALQVALDLYAGEYLPGVHAEWVLAVRAECRAWSVQARLETAMLHCQAAQCSVAVRHLARALQADPLAGENYHQDLMSCLASVEDKYVAVEHYRRFIAFLREDLNDNPMRETVALAERLKGGERGCVHAIGSAAPCARQAARAHLDPPLPGVILPARPGPPGAALNGPL